MHIYIHVLSNRHTYIHTYIGKGVIPYIHDFSVTDNYAVLVEYPLRMSLDKFLSDKGFFPQMEWLGDRGGKTRIHVFDLRNRYNICMYVLNVCNMYVSTVCMYICTVCTVCMYTSVVCI